MKINLHAKEKVFYINNETEKLIEEANKIYTEKFQNDNENHQSPQ
jgi:hypothetical protein